MSSSYQLTIALDFDGTLVTHKYPDIGEEIPGAVEAVKELIEDGHRLILWTVREGKFLEEALTWCAERGLVFYSVNSNYPEETPQDKYYSRKLRADLFIDDRSLGGLPDWPTIVRMIREGRPLEPPTAVGYAGRLDETHREMMERYQKRSKRNQGGLFSKLFK